MSKKIIGAMAILVSVFIQTSVLPVLFGGHQPPNFILMAVVVWTVVYGFSAAFPWIIFCGIVFDLFSHSIAGSNVVIFVLISYLISFLSGRLLIESKNWGSLVMAFFVLISTFFYRIMIILLQGRVQEIADSYAKFFQYSAKEAICNIVLFFLIFFAVNKINKYFYRSEKIIFN